MDSIILYGSALVLLGISYLKDKKKTKMALKKGWKSFENILPQFLWILLLVGILLAVLNTATISKIIGNESGIFGVMLAAIVGGITLIPGFIAFSTASALLNAGAGIMQIAAFISSLMMVGVVTMPVEMKTFGKKTTLLRNGLAFLFSFVVAFIFGLAVNWL
ncbi:MAG: permease [Erysipelotrichaceae bacterium]|nr:permease [Erysipelotrichaceae bacterium]